MDGLAAGKPVQTKVSLVEHHAVSEETMDRQESRLVYFSTPGLEQIEVVAVSKQLEAWPLFTGSNPRDHDT